MNAAAHSCCTDCWDVAKQKKKKQPQQSFRKTFWCRFALYVCVNVASRQKKWHTHATFTHCVYLTLGGRHRSLKALLVVTWLRGEFESEALTFSWENMFLTLSVNWAVSLKESFHKHDVLFRSFPWRRGLYFNNSFSGLFKKSRLQSYTGGKKSALAVSWLDF